MYMYPPHLVLDASRQAQLGLSLPTTAAMPASATPGMQPPAVIKPPPKPQKVGGLSSAKPTPEFMWCQRSDRVYITIKVADCQKANVNISGENVLEFSGLGHGMCGQRDVQRNSKPDSCKLI